MQSWIGAEVLGKLIKKEMKVVSKCGYRILSGTSKPCGNSFAHTHFKKPARDKTNLDTFNFVSDVRYCH